MKEKMLDQELNDHPKRLKKR